MRRFWSEDRGFTLIEVLTTITVVDIVFSIASSTWLNVVQSRAVDFATNQLASDLRLAHTSATNQLTYWAVVNDPTAVEAGPGIVLAGSWGCYLVRIPQPPALIGSEYIRGRVLGEDNRAQIATSTPVSVQFNPDGSAYAADNSTLDEAVTTTVHKNGSTENANKHHAQIIRSTSRGQVDPPTP